MTGNSWAPAANAKYEHGAGDSRRTPGATRQRGEAAGPCPIPPPRHGRSAPSQRVKGCASGSPTKRLLAPLKRRSCSSKSPGRSAPAERSQRCRDPRLPARRRPGARTALSAPQRLRPTAPTRSQLLTLAPAPKLRARSMPTVPSFQKGGN